jgi:hypothetical protein
LRLRLVGLTYVLSNAWNKSMRCRPRMRLPPGTSPMSANARFHNLAYSGTHAGTRLYGLVPFIHRS